MMKKRILLVGCLLLAMGARAEIRHRIAETDTVYMYGIDYSGVKAVGVDESELRFVRVFEEINDLFLSQPEKYDCGNMINKTILVDIDPICRHNTAADYSGMIQRRRNFSSSVDVAAAVANYRLQETEGIGMVFIAELLDKGRGCAVHQVVCFDIATREVLFDRRVETKAGGFGLRNYWANAVYEVIRRVRIAE